MIKSRIEDMIRESDLLGSGTISSEFIRMPCPWRVWTHGSPVGAPGNTFWIDLKTLRCGCFVCGDRSSLWEVLAFRGLLSHNKKMQAFADEVLSNTTEEEGKDSRDSFDEGVTKVGMSMSKEIETSLDDVFHGLDVSSPLCTEYVTKRGFEWDFLRASFNCRYDRDRKRLVLPILGKTLSEKGVGSKLIGLAGRTVVDGVMPKVRYYFGSKMTFGFGKRVFCDYDSVERIFLVEGMFDMFRCFKHLETLELTEEVEVLSLNGCSLSKQQEAILSGIYKPVYLLLDNDKAGKEGALDIERRLKKLVPYVERLLLPEKVKDPDELTLAQFERGLESL